MNDQHGHYEYIPQPEVLRVGVACPHVRVNGDGERYCVLGESVTPRQLAEAVALLRRCAADFGLSGHVRADVAAWLRENAREGIARESV